MLDLLKIKNAALLLALVITISTEINAQGKGQENALIPYVEITVNRQELAEAKLQLLADSLNNFSGGTPPSFLYNECLDWDGSFWTGLHSPISVRWQILNKVNNKAALNKLLQGIGNALKKKCKLRAEDGYPNLEIPKIQQSFYRLIKKKYRELNRN